MTDKRMLIVDAEVARRINENRGDMSNSDFINFLIDSQLKGDEAKSQNMVSKEEFDQFAAGMKDLLRNFLEFFLSYGLELGRPPQDKGYEELTQKLQALSNQGKTKKL
ncbi:MAG: hypothetical protein V1771_01935 [Chloroflexota bacterium]